jgi:hypothetical protein
VLGAAGIPSGSRAEGPHVVRTLFVLGAAGIPSGSRAEGPHVVRTLFVLGAAGIPSAWAARRRAEPLKPTMPRSLLAAPAGAPGAKFNTRWPVSLAFALASASPPAGTRAWRRSSVAAKQPISAGDHPPSRVGTRTFALTPAGRRLRNAKGLPHGAMSSD